MGKFKGKEIEPKGVQKAVATKQTKQKGVSCEKFTDSPKMTRSHSKRSLETRPEEVNKSKRKKAEQNVSARMTQQVAKMQKVISADRPDHFIGNKEVSSEKEKSSERSSLNNNAIVDTALVQPRSSSQGQIIVGSAKSLIDSIKTKRGGSVPSNVTRVSTQPTMNSRGKSNKTKATKGGEVFLRVGENEIMPRDIGDGVQVTVNSSDDNYEEEMDQTSETPGSLSSSKDSSDSESNSDYLSLSKEKPPPPKWRRPEQNKRHAQDSDLDDEEIESL